MANDIGPRRGQVNDTEHDAKSETKEKQLIQKTQDGQQLRNHNYGFENTVDPTTMYNAWNRPFITRSAHAIRHVW
jgi:hypothetical protein